MAVSWTIDHQARTVNATGEGALTFDDIKDYLDGVAAAGGMSYAKLFDISAADTQLTMEDLGKLGGSIRQYAIDSQGPLGPLAIVVGHSQGHLQAARFADTAVSNRPLRIFRDRAQALAWLREQNRKK